ncbi:DUF2975 domain-containing protein [Asinibacterium sp. OR53]|uniref:DUF2975 domain-containing protein n=1 Tax=Asinibacterium sp. OR53 TaxID=925409 RepID=UPI0018DC28E8|nr:DUF2975 domain-containing protein [Asinibacterium sp. OR53]
MLAYWGLQFFHFADGIPRNRWGAQLVGEKPLSSIDRQISHINDSLPHYRYQQIKQQLLQSKEKQEAVNSTFQTLDLGSFGLRNKWNSPGDSYLSLKNYSLDTQSYVYHDSGKTYLSSPVWDNFVINADGTVDYTKGHWVAKPLKIDISADDKPSEKSVNQAKIIQIPLSKQLSNILQVSLLIIGFVIAVLFLYVFIALPIAVIQNIALGEVFSQRNIKSIRVIAFTLIIISVICIIAPFVFHVIFSDVIPKELHFMYRNIFKQELGWLVAGLVILVVAQAFNQGKKLQEDQNLTI